MIFEFNIQIFIEKFKSKRLTINLIVLKLIISIYVTKIINLFESSKFLIINFL